MRNLSPRLLIAAAICLLTTACASASSLELKRVQRPNVKVAAGRDGYVHPLTGVQYYTLQSWQRRPALAIKYGNTSRERPQAGLDKADLVYEELVEGDETRFLAFFSSQDAARVGPVRSVRTVDAKIVQPIGGLFAYSGGVGPIVATVRAVSAITDVSEGRRSGAYRRDPDRPMPYNLYSSTENLWQGELGAPPQKQFEFLLSSDPTDQGGVTGRDLRLSFGGSSSVSYEFNDRTGRYDRSTRGSAHLVEDTTNGGTTQLGFRNVLVQMVQVSAGYTVDRAGARTREISVVGEGAAVLFRGGRAIRGHWSRPSAGSRTEFTDSAGQPLRLAPGTTIVELVPRGQDLFVT